MKLVWYLPLSTWILLTLAACITGIAPAVTPSPVATHSSGFGVFEGITPCSPLTRALPQIPADTNCEQMIWKLRLDQDPQTGMPTSYALESAYGLPLQGTNALVGGGTPIVMEGKWVIRFGTKSDPDAVVYQLNPDHPRTSVSFLKISDDVLHVLDSDRALLLGNAAWSYTLNRTDQRMATPVTAAEPPASPTRPVIPPVPSGSSVLGSFEGRTPCHKLVFEFTRIKPYASCLKVKWVLTLYRDSDTGAPSTYLYWGTHTVREGAWTIVTGTPSDPDAIVYQLKLDEAQTPTSFLKADGNHLFLLDRALNILVGNELFSYTLSRTKRGAQ